MPLPPQHGYLSIRVLWAVVVAAVIINHDVSVLIVEAGGGDQLPAAAVLREVVSGGTRPDSSDTGRARLIIAAMLVQSDRGSVDLPLFLEPIGKVEARDLYYK